MCTLGRGVFTKKNLFFFRWLLSKVLKIWNASLGLIQNLYNLDKNIKNVLTVQYQLKITVNQNKLILIPFIKILMILTREYALKSIAKNKITII